MHQAQQIGPHHRLRRHPEDSPRGEARKADDATVIDHHHRIGGVADQGLESRLAPLPGLHRDKAKAVTDNEELARQEDAKEREEADQELGVKMGVRVPEEHQHDDEANLGHDRDQRQRAKFHERAPVMVVVRVDAESPAGDEPEAQGHAGDQVGHVDQDTPRDAARLAYRENDVRDPHQPHADQEKPDGWP